MPIRHVSNLVTTCICLHNLCIIHRDKFDEEWTKEGEKFIHRESTNQLEQLENVDIFMTTIQAAKEITIYLKIDEFEGETMQIEALKKLW